MNILLAGGGIGGLTAALCLARSGHQVDLFEQAPAFAEAGAGIQLSPNCSRVLHHLGLEQALRARAFLPEGTEFRDWKSGKTIAARPLGAQILARYGAPYYHIHRGDLLGLLVDAAEHSSAIRLHTGARIEGFTQNASGVQVQVNANETAGDLLIGADGIRSVVRATLWGEQQPRFTGNVAWRALVPANRLPAGLVRPMSTVWWGPNKHFVHYYVAGGTLVNCVCVVEKTGWEVESWTEPGDASELAADFAGWHSDIQSLIHHVDPTSLYKWALHDRPPMPQWGTGRVTLLGDACHPTLPFMAQGAAMAIEDGAVLAACLAQGDNPVASLRRYEDLRRGRTAGIQKASARNATIFHLAGVKARLRNLGAQTASGKTMADLFGYNALEVANR